MQYGSSVGIYRYTLHTRVFFACLAPPICMLSRCLLTKFLHQSSVASLLRVRCWLGWLKQTLLKNCPFDGFLRREPLCTAWRNDISYPSTVQKICKKKKPWNSRPKNVFPRNEEVCETAETEKIFLDFPKK